MSKKYKTRLPGDKLIENHFDEKSSAAESSTDKEVIVSVKIKKELLGDVVSSLAEISSAIEVNHFTDQELIVHDEPGKYETARNSEIIWINEKEYLTPREVDILERLLLGRTNKEIAADLGLKENTVRNNMQRIFRKFKVNNRTEANIFFTRIRTGLLNHLKKNAAARKEVMVSTLY